MTTLPSLFLFSRATAAVKPPLKFHVHALFAYDWYQADLNSKHEHQPLRFSSPFSFTFPLSLSLSSLGLTGAVTNSF